ncbi:MAG: hypothetical protein WD041_04120 [Nitriliruptoraceae bacterium]
MTGIASTKDERALTWLSVLFGSFAMVAHVVTMAYPPAAVLMFSIPLATATTGRLRGNRLLQQVALAVGVALAVTYALAWPALIEFVLVTGPIAVLYLVGTLLRTVDRFAAIVWVATSAVAFASGLLLTASNAGVSIALSLVALGLLVALLRVRRWMNSA